MKWKKTDFLVYFICSLSVFIVSWLFIRNNISYYELAVVWFCDWQLELLTDPFVRGKVIRATLPIVIELSVPTKLQTFLILPRYEMAWPLLFALIIPLPFLKWKRKVLHVLLGSFLCAAGIAVHFYVGYFYVAFHGPGGIEFLRDIGSYAFFWFLMLNDYIGTFLLPLVYWFCIINFPGRERTTGDVHDRTQSLPFPLKDIG